MYFHCVFFFALYNSLDIENVRNHHVNRSELNIFSLWLPTSFFMASVGKWQPSRAFLLRALKHPTTQYVFVG